MSAAPDMMKPEYVALHTNLESMGIEMCPDKLHLCPATADCCKTNDGKWDCCPKAAAIEVLHPVGIQESLLHRTFPGAAGTDATSDECAVLPPFHPEVPSQFCISDGF
ncbi:hypothetical protein CEXT_366371 [Caerostris extrusa]|uniref:Granulins domain-containing protein n=1 Tax=Caerostris extrusa TaxID=172846 RepID=A0AAV4VWE0_CAEEX|nr:hypothetical protein CEXT_366371 [Caerostris extrusa]